MARITITSGAIAALALLGASLSACGFTPIYAERTGVAAKLGAVSLEVRSPTARTEFLVRHELAQRLGDGGSDYVLAVTVQETRQGFGIRIDNVATRYDLVLTTNYTLTDAATQKVVTSGAAFGQSSYDVTDEPYADIALEERARERAAALAADKIRRDLAFAFARANAS